ncbi:MAG: hypothetical protein Q4Q62_04335 [Thermoplasmata archaeon]|nr:hypothetical protein [Thermoplasmata archaeon]
MTEECRVCVDAGVCKMKTLITARDNGMGLIEIDIKSDCPNVLKMSWKLEPMSPYAEVEAEFSKSSVYKLADEAIPHTACPVPAGIIKALEVAGDLGLKRDSSIRFLQEGEEVDIS